VSQKKCANFETVYLKIIRIDFDDIWQKYSEDSRIEFACFIFRGNFVINYQATLALHSYRLLIKILSSLLNGAMLTGSVGHNFQNLRYFRCPFWKMTSW